MTDFHIEVIKITNIRQHPNGDRLEIIDVHDGFPCIVKKDQFKVGDLAVYVPVDVVLPEQHFEFLQPKERKRLKAKKIRGVFSMGLLIENICNWQEGDEVAEQLNITRWEPKETKHVPGQGVSKTGTGGENEPAPDHFDFITYTDIENIRKYHYVFTPNEEVILHEKIHGSNCRFVHDGERLWVGSRECIKRNPIETHNPEYVNAFWEAAFKHDLINRLKEFPNKVFCGEVFGKVQDLRYGHQNDVDFVLFDIYDTQKRCYLDYDDAVSLNKNVGLTWVPLIYRGPWTTLQDYLSYAEGDTLIQGANNIREGFVMRPTKERWHEKLGRVIVKCHGQGYLLRP